MFDGVALIFLVYDISMIISAGPGGWNLPDMMQVRTDIASNVTFPVQLLHLTMTMHFSMSASICHQMLCRLVAVVKPKWSIWR